MGIEWRNSLNIGIEEIDNQHKELVARFSNLLDACNAGKGNKEVFRLLTFLDEYVVSHFAAEEKLQRECGYPDCERHSIEHEKFKHQLQELKDRFTLESSGVYLAITTNKVMIQWLIEHISKMDVEIAKHISGKRD